MFIQLLAYGVIFPIGVVFGVSPFFLHKIDQSGSHTN